VTNGTAVVAPLAGLVVLTLMPEGLFALVVRRIFSLQSTNAHPTNTTPVLHLHLKCRAMARAGKFWGVP